MARSSAWWARVMRSPVPASITEWSPTTEPPRRRGEADRARLARAGVAVAHAHVVAGKRDAARRGRLAKSSAVPEGASPCGGGASPGSRCRSRPAPARAPPAPPEPPQIDAQAHIADFTMVAWRAAAAILASSPAVQPVCRRHGRCAPARHSRQIPRSPPGW